MQRLGQNGTFLSLEKSQARFLQYQTRGLVLRDFRPVVLWTDDCLGLRAKSAPR
jgi:hypothetical protein